ncbi:MAG: pyridoxamine 5'-phosphate oxidase [Phycisphaerales bacterium]
MNPIAQTLYSTLLGKSPLGDTLPEDPMPLVATWLAEAESALGRETGPAMALATTGADGVPSVRMVLCKGLSVSPPTITFFTNYESRKASELDANPRVAAVFHWAAFTRQVRIEGVARRASAEASDAYFRSRALLSKLGAWASNQSRPLARRTDLVASVVETATRFGAVAALASLGEHSDAIPRPPHWGGYDIEINAVELWSNVSGRLHDRARWTYTSGAARPWSGGRLQP